VINAAFENDRLRFFVGIRIPLLKLGFGITLAAISLASVGGSPEFLRHQISSHLTEECSTPAKARRLPKVAELVDLLRDRMRESLHLDHAVELTLPHLRQSAAFVAGKKSVWQERTFGN
jgi:hypothetical protein